MAKTSTPKTTKAAKDASTKTKASKQPKLNKDGSPKGPSPWSVFLKNNLKTYKDTHPQVSHREAMQAMSTLWDKSPLNSNAGKPKKPKKPRVTKSAGSLRASSDDEGPQVEPGSDE